MESNCNICESEKKKYLFNAGGRRRIVRCDDCGLVYMENPINDSEISDYYDEELYTGPNGTALTSGYAKGEEFRVKEADERLDDLGKRIQIDSLLDIGCGIGFFVRTASDRGIDAVGIDISKKAVAYGQEHRINVRLGDILYINDFDNKLFNVVTFWASIEHLYYPKQTLQKVHNLLKPKGLVVIETGDISSYQARVFGDNWRLIQPEHNFYYSSSTLDKILRQTGFKVIHTTQEGFVESLIAQIGIRDLVIEKFTQTNQKAKERKSSLKEKINRIAGRMHLGDVMIKYAIKD